MLSKLNYLVYFLLYSNKLSGSLDFIFNSEIQQEIQNLQTDREEIESNINYVSDLMERVEELPNDNIDLLVELDEQKKNLNEVYTQVGKEINALSKVLKAVEDALQYAIDLVHSIIKSFENIGYICRYLFISIKS